MYVCMCVFAYVCMFVCRMKVKRAEAVAAAVRKQGTQWLTCMYVCIVCVCMCTAVRKQGTQWLTCMCVSVCIVCVCMCMAVRKQGTKVRHIG